MVCYYDELRHHKESENAARAVCYTQDGSVLAMSDGERISIRNGDDNVEFASIAHKDVSKLAISPDAKYVCTFVPFRKTPEYPQGRPNLLVFEVASREMIDSRVHTLSETWRPQWSLDSNLCVRVWQGEIQFYVDNNLGGKPAKRLTLKGMRHCSLSKSPRNRHLAVYTPGEKSTPATVYIYAWRNGDCVPVANKSFFRADTVSFHWSDIGTSLLVLTSTKMSENSYYGEQMLHFLTTTKSGDSATVPMPRSGPIHQVLWRPSGGLHDRPSDEQFVICQGSLPSSVLVFNIKCEKLYSLGTGPWNQVYFNPQGSLLLAGGFGSLDGSVTVWDYKSQHRICEFSARNTTYLSWLPDGEHIVTATTTPRLRIDNGWTVWHFTGRPVAHETVEKRANPRPATVDLPAATEHELYQVLPRPMPLDRLPPPPALPTGWAANGKSAAQARNFRIPFFCDLIILDLPGLPAVRLEKPKAYVPPSLRNRSATAIHAANVASGRSNRDLHSATHLAFTLDSGTSATASHGPIGGVAVESGASKQGGKRKKKGGDSGGGNQRAEVPQPLPNQKQINFLKKKLGEIEKLKALQKTTKLENTQLEKIAREEGLRRELEQLELFVLPSEVLNAHFGPFFSAMTVSTVRMRRYNFTLPKSVNTPGPLTERGIQGFVTYILSWWWAIIIPWSLLVALFGGVGIYLWMNRYLVHPLSSINLVCDATNSELGLLLRKDDSEEDRQLFESHQQRYAFIPDGGVMPPTLDLSLDWVNKQLYLRSQGYSI
ncbi:Eukaryotic translation initiation factor 2A [Echinococcus granulosus]|uniref:Eukaryotic translation initiation factor 2A n=1 Tax=Echinococcus granulosus TaxID=6210 RepID=W6UIA9_ECHGR|nr:Eukaryotic translation initiation factor 2A [Echinococcus granulosus]EUB61215.1 Eukaryotic translation initiation factor 2A [Echinococcus granulosus]